MDRRDAGILAELQNDARLSNKELAGRVGLAPSSCLERVRRLRRDGVLRGFHARVAPAALGIGLREVAHPETTLVFEHEPRRALPDYTAGPGAAGAFPGSAGLDGAAPRD